MVPDVSATDKITLATTWQPEKNIQTVYSIVSILTENSYAMCVYFVCCPVYQVVQPLVLMSFFYSIKILEKPTFSAKLKLKEKRALWVTDFFLFDTGCSFMVVRFLSNLRYIQMNEPPTYPIQLIYFCL